MERVCGQTRLVASVFRGFKCTDMVTVATKDVAAVRPGCDPGELPGVCLFMVVYLNMEYGVYQGD